METLLTLIGQFLGSTLAALSICQLIFYNKAQINDKLTEMRQEINDNALERQKNISAIKDALADKIDKSKQSFEEALKEFINVLSDIKQADKDNAIQYITLIDSVKDELKNDYTCRYNDLLTLINSKASMNDFTRMEQKFDKVGETITELKIIVETQLKTKKEKP